MLETREGKRVPEVTFKTRQDNDWVDVTTKDLFGGKNVIVFALPGAFTPTCSAKHLPRYNQLAPVFKANGVDDIICMSVNDAFVMNCWKEDQEAENITVIPDGNGEFSNGMGMLVDKCSIGFGNRSWRYSMLVKDGVVEKMFVEPEVEGDPFEVSDADTMLEYINANADKPKSISVFTRKGCPYCAKAKAALAAKGVEFEEIILGKDITSHSLRAIAGATTVPQIFVDGEHIGDEDALDAYLA
jgi:glutathione-dependent peroxiredoxin